MTIIVVWNNTVVNMLKQTIFFNNMCSSMHLLCVKISSINLIGWGIVNILQRKKGNNIRFNCDGNYVFETFLFNLILSMVIEAMTMSDGNAPP